VKVTASLSLCVPRRHIRRSRTICSTDSWHTQRVSCTHPKLPGESCHDTHWTGCWVGPGVGVDTMDKGQSVSPARNWTLDCPAAAQSLYTSNYANPAPLFANIRQYPDTVNGNVQHRGCSTGGVLTKLSVSGSYCTALPTFCMSADNPPLSRLLSFLPSARFRNLLCL
jgi:hypothetical protein